MHRDALEGREKSNGQNKRKKRARRELQES
jgi:hypothetical protein